MSTSTLSSFDSQHQDMVHDAQMDYYGKRLATCSSDKTIKIFDVGAKNTQTHVADLLGHQGPVWELEWAHPKFGSILASCSYDRKVIIWKEVQANRWDKLYEYSGHELSVNSISWAPHENGLMLACASSDGSVSVLTWKSNDWSANKFSAHRAGVNSISWAPAVTLAGLSSPDASESSPQFVTGGCDNAVKLWRLNTNTGEWENTVSFDGHSDWVRDVAWAPTVSPTSTIASCGQDGKVFIWTLPDPKGTWQKQELTNEKYTAPNWRVSWSITGNILAVSSGDNQVTLWKQNMKGAWQCLSNLSAAGGGVGGEHSSASGVGISTE